MSSPQSLCYGTHPNIAGYFLGIVFSIYLHGALTVQLYRYYISFPNDPKLFKVVMYIVYLAGTICTVLPTYDLGTTITGTAGIAGDICFYDSWVYLSITVCGGIEWFLTQSMYAYRIQIITKWKYVSWVIILVLASQLVGLVVASILRNDILFFVPLIYPSVSLTVDVTITSIMVWCLKKDEIYSKQLKKKITRLIYLIIGTGFLTAATNLVVLVLLFYSPPYSTGLLIALSKLYANSMMVLVNSRIPSARSEINHRATLDMITVRLSPIHTTSQAAAGVEHGQREISVDPEARGAALSAHNGEDTTNNYDLGSLTV